MGRLSNDYGVGFAVGSYIWFKGSLLTYITFKSFAWNFSKEENWENRSCYPKEVGYGISSSVSKKLADAGDIKNEMLGWLKISVKRCCFAGQSVNGMYRI